MTGEYNSRLDGEEMLSGWGNEDTVTEMGKVLLGGTQKDTARMC
jgi:hypothetical protein